MRGQRFVVSMIAALSVGPAIAAPIALFPTPTFVGNFGAGRSSYFEVLSPVDLTQIGIRMNPVASTDVFTFQVFESDAVKSIGTELLATSTSFTDVDLADYDINVNLSLDPGFYFLVITPPVITPVVFYDERNGGLPFISSDGNFRVVDGDTFPLIFQQNVFLPAFSVATALSVPEPSSVALLTAALLGLGLARRKRSISRSMGTRWGTAC